MYKMYSEFENIKVGEKVLVLKKVVTSGKVKSFLVGEKVTRVTRTQFATADGRRWTKRSGSEIGGNTCCLMITDKFKDQVAAYNEAKANR